MPKSLLVSILGLGLMFSAPVVASDYEELSYNDLVNQLARKRDNSWKPQPPTDEIMIHAGFGIVSSANQVRFPGEMRSRPLNGFQLSLGIDLLSRYWMGEFVFRNFADHRSGGETRSLRETDWKVLHRTDISSKLETRFGIGYGSRTLRLNDPTTGYGFEQDTPVGLVTAGLEAHVSRSVSLGIETGLRAALVTNTTDVNSLDLTMRLESRF